MRTMTPVIKILRLWNLMANVEILTLLTILLMKDDILWKQPGTSLKSIYIGLCNTYLRYQIFNYSCEN